MVDFGDESTLHEELAVCDETLLERYFEQGTVADEDVVRLIRERKVFPCFFGSALRLDGVDALLDALDRRTVQPEPQADFGARVFKVARDAQGNRLTYMKITGGSLAVRAQLSGGEDGGWQEKVNQLRVYSGEKFTAVERAEPGMVVAATGLTHTAPGMGLGAAAGALPPVLEPVLSYRVGLPDGCDAHTMLRSLRQLEEEDPLLRVVWNEQLGEIHLQLMGEVQLEILTELIESRFGVRVTFDEGSIVYRETIAEPVIGIGHFEPLRHYAEVHLLMEPGERGSGITLATACSTDELDLNWQRLILTHLAEKAHLGVLTGAPLTDVHITLIAGRAHVKHTEGGDFREATYRAVRNNGTFEPPQPLHGGSVLTGKAPVASMRNYWTEVASYTKGRGRLSCTPGGYEVCHNTEAVVTAIGYDAERDTENTADSVFCSHGAGYVVHWDEVRAHAHLDTSRVLAQPEEEAEPASVPHSGVRSSGFENDSELRALFERTYGPVRDRGFEALQQSRKKAETLEQLYVTRIRQDDYLLVDGYNIIFAWDELKAIAAEDVNAARERLVNIMSNYQGVRRCHLILVFDAYKVKGGTGSVEKRHGIHIVYTREAETADMYIEQASYDLSRRHRVRVATSDGMEQMIILGHGAERMSATELKWEVEQADEHLHGIIQNLQP